MQLTPPIFPSGTRLISSHVGVYEEDGLVNYIVNGMPVFTHGKGYHKAFRYFISNLIDQGLCKKVDVQNCFG